MNVFDPLLATRLIVVLGIINLLTGALVVFSCRCLPGSKVGSRIMKNKGYQRFYKYHCYIWRVFWPSVMIHAILALIIFGWPG
jgi:hypothetical protein